MPDDDSADRLQTPEEMAAHINAAMESSDGDGASVGKALGECARAKGMQQVARAAGVSRDTLYRWLDGKRSPNFQPILRVVRALGLRFTAEAVESWRLTELAIERCPTRSPGR